MIINEFILDYDGQQLSCSVPCSLYSVLLQHELIPDPYFADNASALTALSDRGYTFYSDFTVPHSELKDAPFILKLAGIDTVCTVVLNGVILGQTRNLHRTWRFPCGDALCAGDNRLELRFESPTAYAASRQKANRVWGQTGGVTLDGISQIRKPSYMFGWDWAPQLPDMGIYIPAKIEPSDRVEVEDVFFRQRHSEGRVELTALLKARGATSARLEVTAPDGAKHSAVYTEGKASLTIDRPMLWWPNGYGEQPLYECATYINGEDSPADVRTIGLRTCTVSREQDGYGSEFCFVVNGVKIFAMGANYVPCDSIVSRITGERIRRIAADCAEAGFNCIRIWGGGFYADDALLDACDRAGLILWHDCMFACTMTPATSENIENITCELIENITRMRNHPCLGLLCGNNEVEEAVASFDELKDDEQLKKDYIEIFEKTIAGICRQYAPDTFYWPSSPCSGGGLENYGDENHGDNHHWAVWHGYKPFSDYREHFFRFCSEFGFESFPCVKTISAFAAPEDMNPFSYIMEKHQKCGLGNTKMMFYMSQRYKLPKDIRSFVYASQLLQADAMKSAVEHMRRHRGRCMGALYWQLNDSWPAASWSSIDYFGRRKALYYAAKRFCAPVLLSAHESGDCVILNLSSELREEFHGKVEWEVISADGSKVFDCGSIPVVLPALTSKDVAELDLSGCMSAARRDRLLSYRLTDCGGDRISSGMLTLVAPKHFNFHRPDITVAAQGGDGSFTLTLTAKAPAADVYIDSDCAELVLSDNFFSITDSRPVVITARCGDRSLTAGQLMRGLTVMSAYDIGL